MNPAGHRAEPEGSRIDPISEESSRSEKDLSAAMLRRSDEFLAGMHPEGGQHVIRVRSSAFPHGSPTGDHPMGHLQLVIALAVATVMAVAATVVQAVEIALR